jgi:hypothetical protein
MSVEAFVVAFHDGYWRMQKLLIANLTLKGRPTKGAEADLKKYQAFLAQLRNHRETMASLMGPTTGQSI